MKTKSSPLFSKPQHIVVEAGSALPLNGGVKCQNEMRKRQGEWGNTHTFFSPFPRALLAMAVKRKLGIPLVHNKTYRLKKQILLTIPNCLKKPQRRTKTYDQIVSQYYTILLIFFIPSLVCSYWYRGCFFMSEGAQTLLFFLHCANVTFLVRARTDSGGRWITGTSWPSWTTPSNSSTS